MIKPELKTLTPIQPGFALLLLKGWKGDAEGVTISVVRNQDRLYLDSHGDWVSGEIFLALPPLIQNEETPCVQVGPSLIDPLLANRQAAYRITIKDGSNKDMGILTIAEGLLSSQAGGENPLPENIQTLNDTPIVQPMSVQEPEPVVLEPVAEKPVSQQPQKPKSKLPLFAGLAILLLLLAAAGWWFTRKPEPAIPAAPPAPVAKITGPCGDEQMASGNEMAFVKGACVASQVVHNCWTSSQKRKRQNIAISLSAFTPIKPSPAIRRWPFVMHKNMTRKPQNQGDASILTQRQRRIGMSRL